MKYCYHCGRITPGEPLFCNVCGRSFNHKLCPRLHVNPRSAEICSRCGSRELSTPQPKVGFKWRAFEWLTRTFGGVLLAILSLFFIGKALEEFLQSAVVQGGVVAIVMALTVLWWIWSELPEWFRKFIRKQLHRRRHRTDEE